MDSVFVALDAVFAVLLAGAFAMITFTHREIKAARIILIIASAVLVSRWLMWGFVTNSPWWARGIAGALIGALIVGGLPAVWRWSKERAPVAAATSAARPAQPTKPWKHTLEELYGSDFPDLGSSERTPEVQISDPSRGLQPTTVKLRFRLYYDFRSNTDFLSIFIPVSHNVLIDDKIYDIIKSLRDEIPAMRDDLQKSIGFGLQGPGVPYTEAKDMKSSGRVFIYTMQVFTVIKLGELTSWYQDAGMSLQIRGSDYWAANKDR